MSAISDKIRKEFGESDKKRDAANVIPADVERFTNLQYARDDSCQKLDVYRPKGINGSLPVIISVHGGAWVYGDKELYQFYCMSLARHGFAVVNFTYRLAPEHKYPDCVEDLNSVAAWILENKTEYGFDCSHIFAVGDSAGAHILGVYTNIITNHEYAGKYSFKVPDGFYLTAIGLHCGKYSFDDACTSEQDRDIMRDVLPSGGTAEELELINVINHITPDFAPALIMTANCDFLKDQAPLLQQKFMKCNIPHELHVYGDKNTQVYHVFHLNMQSELAHSFNKLQCDYFKRFL